MTRIIDFTDEHKAYLRSVWNNGEVTISSIAVKLRCSVRTVRELGKKLDLGQRGLASDFWTPERLTEASRLYTVDKLSPTAIAERMGTTRNSVVAKLSREGVLNRRPEPKATPEAIVIRTWEPDHVERFKQLHADGLSFSRLTERMNAAFPGAGYTKNACLTKAKRLGLKRGREVIASNLREGARQARGYKSAATKAALKVFGSGTVLEMPASPPPKYVVKEAAWEPLPGSEPVTIMGLRSNSCRWPVELLDETEPHYCGEFATDRSYCGAHGSMRDAADQPRDLGKLEKRAPYMDPSIIRRRARAA